MENKPQGYTGGGVWMGDGIIHRMIFLEVPASTNESHLKAVLESFSKKPLSYLWQDVYDHAFEAGRKAGFKQAKRWHIGAQIVLASLAGSMLTEIVCRFLAL